MGCKRHWMDEYYTVTVTRLEVYRLFIQNSRKPMIQETSITQRPYSVLCTHETG
jgi:hypothetical protein